MKVKINGKEYEAEQGKTILEMCQDNNIDVPHLCYHPDLEKGARCRICIVEEDGKIVTSCNTYPKEGADIQTETERVKHYRKLNMELKIAGHDLSEPTELNELAKKLGVKESRFKAEKNKTVDVDGPALCRDNNKCILCGRCVQKCQDIQTVYAIGFTRRSHSTEIMPYCDHIINDVACVYCGQCTTVCPTGAIFEKDYTEGVMNAIKDTSKHVIVQTAPSIRAALGETQGMEPGRIVTGEMVAALRKLGFDRILDTNFGADLTIVEEANELVQRIKKNGVLPMITSCSPGWVKFIEHFFPDLLPHVSTCKSPQQMFGALSKTYYAKKNNLNPKDIVSVSIMPCVAKKFEMQRPEMNASGFQDVDYSITTRELGRMIKNAEIDFENLPDEQFDPLMGTSTGAGAIFGATGGVMEAALRTAADTLEGKDLENIEYTAVRGLKGIKEATVEIAGMKMNVAVAHGLGNARRLLECVSKEKSRYHFIEIMACPGGCVGGGGQPIQMDSSIVSKRIGAIYNIDKGLPYRKSHKNPEIIQLYKDFLGEYGSHKAHELLHTSYTKRSRF